MVEDIIFLRKYLVAKRHIYIVDFQEKNFQNNVKFNVGYLKKFLKKPRPVNFILHLKVSNYYFISLQNKAINFLGPNTNFLDYEA